MYPDLYVRKEPIPFEDKHSSVAREQAGAICGFLFAQEKTIGPWMAENEAVAEVLLRRALALSFADNQIVFAPAANEGASHLLDAYGFRRARALPHMRRGARATFRQREKTMDRPAWHWASDLNRFNTSVAVCVCDRQGGAHRGRHQP